MSDLRHLAFNHLRKPHAMNARASGTFSRRLLLGGGTAATLGLAAPVAAADPRTPASRTPGQLRRGRPALTHGVQSGDVRVRKAVLWSRADRPARLIAEISRGSDFRKALTIPGPVVTPRSDLTGEIDLAGLTPGTEYHYRIRAVDLHDPRRGSEPLAGRFRTASNRPSDVRFLWSGDIAGQGWGVNPDFGGFRIADAMRARNADFFLCSGDNVYADGPVTESVDLPDGSTWKNLVIEEKTKVAETLDEYRAQFKYNLLADNWRAFLAETPQVTQWDDHEVTNNWYPGEILDDDRYTVTDVDTLAERSRQAFHEYMPVARISPDPDGRLYRVINYGPLLDVFVLDMRTHKDPNTSGTETVPDGGLLGERQTRWLIRELTRSKATWKIIANDLPVGLIVPDGEAAQEGVGQGDPGAPRGRELDLAPVLSALKNAGVRNHVWLTADVHYTAAHHYSPDRAAFDDFDPFWEFVSGPLNAGGFGPNTLDSTFGPKAEFVAAPPAPNTSPAEGYQFFGEVEIDGTSRELTVILRDVDGKSLFSKTLEPARR